jgi:hypothetical protein
MQHIPPLVELCQPFCVSGHEGHRQLSNIKIEMQVLDD